MANLPGWPYPPEVGGCVEEPAFILHCGDFVDGDANGEEALSFYLHCLKQMNLPTFETLGNHDAIFPNVVDYFVKKYGRRYYSFDQKGFHFVSLYQTFTEDERPEKLDEAQIEWLEKDLSSTASGKPVLLFSHERLDHLPNAEDVESVLRKAKVILMLSGHLHALPCTYTWNGRAGVVIGHCRNHPTDPIFARRIIVVRITQRDLSVAAWRWDLQEWARRQGWNKEEGEHLVITL